MKTTKWHLKVVVWILVAAVLTTPAFLSAEEWIGPDPDHNAICDCDLTELGYICHSVECDDPQHGICVSQNGMCGWTIVPCRNFGPAVCDWQVE